MSGHVSIPSHLRIPQHSNHDWFVPFPPVLLQLREGAMRNPSALEDALAGAMELYDENGDEQALLENLKAYHG